MDRKKFLSVAEEDIGRRLLERLKQLYPIKVAFWLKHVDDEDWHLNVTFEPIDREDSVEAFDKVRQIAVDLGDIDLDPFSMDFLDKEYPLVQRAIELQDEVLVTRSHSQKVLYRGSPVEGIVVYPRRDLSSKAPATVS